jgi:hypothetical protein
MIKSYEVRKAFIKDQNAKPKALAFKYNMSLPDIYLYRKQVQEALEGKTNCLLTPTGRFIPANKNKAEPKAPIKLFADKPEAKPTLLSLDKHINELVQNKQVSYKVGYAIHLLSSNRIKEAVSLLSDA